MIIVCFIYFDNSLFLAVIRLYSQCQNISFLLCSDEKSPFQVGKYQRKNQRFFRVNCVKIVCLSDIFNRPTVGISVVLLPCKSSRCTIRGPRVLRPRLNQRIWLRLSPVFESRRISFLKIFLVQPCLKIEKWHDLKIACGVKGYLGQFII